jgi:S-adenosyl methyltransferase
VGGWIISKLAPPNSYRRRGVTAKTHRITSAGRKPECPTRVQRDRQGRKAWPVKAGLPATRPRSSQKRSRKRRSPCGRPAADGGSAAAARDRHHRVALGPDLELLAGRQGHLALADSINVGEAHKEAGRRYEEGGAVPYHLRSPEQIAGFFHGLTLVDPGVVSVSRWRPDPSPFGLPGEVESLAGVARKPFLVT